MASVDTTEGQRLQPVAERALKRYPFLTREVSHLDTHSNVLYRVVAENGQEFVLRVGTPHANSRSNIEVEVAWLDALNRETELEVVRPIATAGGGFIVDEVDSSTGKSHACVLFSWVPGQAVGDGAGPFAYRLLGEMCAQLQAHGRNWSPPAGSTLRHWDRVFYYDREMDPIIIEDPAFGHFFTRDRSRTINRAGAMAETAIEWALRWGTPQIVHGDLHEWNVHIKNNRLYAFDFEDVMVAVPAQDISICLYSSRRSENRDEIRAAFRKGYESVLPWPVGSERQLDSMHAARQIMLMNYAARTLPVAEAEEYLDDVMPWLEDYVDKYG